MTTDFRYSLPLLLIASILVFHILCFDFVCDDAYISFRYGKNFTGGLGLVYNPGENVEGYTNFLWIILLSVFHKLGPDLVILSKIFGALFSVCTLVLCYLLSKSLYGEKNIFNYLTPLFLASCGAFAAWSSGGLETAFFTFLVFLGSYFFIRERQAEKSFPYSAIIFALASMTRPDGLIFAGITFLLLLSNKKRRAFLWGAFFCGVFIPYFLWRWQYYDSFLPNTFYLKASGGPLYKNGFAYVWDFFKRFGVWLYPIPLFFVFLKGYSSPKVRWVIFYFLAMILVFSLYVIYVGGDFMDMFRFLVPVLPFLYFLVGNGFRQMYAFFSQRDKRTTLVLGQTMLILLIFLFLILPSKKSREIWFKDGIESIGLVKENAFLWKRVGLLFKTMAKPDESLATTAAGAIPYYSELKTLDLLGLTADVKESQLKDRGITRAGHGKMLSITDVLHQRPTYILGHPRIRDTIEHQIPTSVGFGNPMILSSDYKLMIVELPNLRNKYINFLKLKTESEGT